MTASSVIFLFCLWYHLKNSIQAKFRSFGFKQLFFFHYFSGIGSNAINEVTLNFWRAGQHREVITLEYLDQPLKASVERHKGI